MEIDEIIKIIGIVVGIFSAIPSYFGAWKRYKNWLKKNPKGSLSKWLREIRQSYLFFLGIFFTILMIGLFIILLLPVQGPEPESGGITTPQNGALVPLEITVEGYVNSELPESQHLYIVVEYGGRWWPQYSEADVGYSSTNRRYEFSTPARIGTEEDIGKTFAIRAILVDSTVHQYFQNWFQSGETEGWAGISTTEVNQKGEVKLFDYVTVLRR